MFQKREISVTWGLQGKLPGGGATMCMGGGIASTVMSEGQRTTKHGRCDKGRPTKAKNMLDFSENNICLHRLGRIIAAFGSQAFELEFDAVIN